MPRESIIAAPNTAKRQALPIAMILVQIPAINAMPKSVSKIVATTASDGAKAGTNELTLAVYVMKCPKSPQETFGAPYGPQAPKRSATAESNMEPIASRANA